MRASAIGHGILLLATVGCSAAGTTVETRRLWSGDALDFATGDISPDGRYFSDVNWASGDLSLVNLETGETKDLTGHGYDAGGYAWTSAFSSDGNRLAVAWYRDELNSHELLVMNVDGTKASVLVPADPARFYVEPLDWSPTNEEILAAVQQADRTWRLELVRVADGSMRMLKTLGWQAPGGGHDQAYPDADFSPDGRFVAYDYPPDREDPARDIYAVAVDGSREHRLVSGPGSDRLLGWVPDGSGILFYSDRGGTPGIWRVTVRDGAAASEPELVRGDVWGLTPIGFSRMGYVYGVATESEKVHTAAVDLMGARVVEFPKPVRDPVWRKSFAGDWSPDGARFAYVTHDPFPDPVETLVLRTAEGEITRSIPLSPTLHASNGTFRWVTQDRILLFAYSKGQDGIWEVDLGAGSFRRIETPASVGRAAIKWFAVGADGRTLYLIGRPAGPGQGNQLVAVDAIAGTHRIVGTAPAERASLAVSPNGKELAFISRNETSQMLALRVMATDGSGSTHTLHRAPLGQMGPPVAWMPDGSRLLVLLRDDDGSPALWAVGRRSGQGEPAKILPACCQENHVRVNRDGRRILLAAGKDVAEVWVLTGYEGVRFTPLYKR